MIAFGSPVHICEENTQVQVGALRRVTLVVEGLSAGGEVIQTRELIVDDVPGFGEKLGLSVGHRFDPFVASVKVFGWWIEPKP